MAITGLTYAEVRSISTKLKTSANTMQQTLESVKKQLNKIGSDNVWSGTAAAEEKAEFDKLTKKFPEFHQAVSDASTYLAQVVTNYEQVDRAIKTGK
mgnify:CR=1 FL=1